MKLRRKRMTIMMNRSKILVLIVLSVFILSLFSMSQLKARAVDLTSDISLTVKMPQGFSEKDTDKISVDIYQIAKAAPVEGSDTYSLSLLSAYEELDLAQLNETGSVDWEKIQADAASIALKDGALQTPDVSNVSLGAKQDLTEIGPGLFLVVAHGDGDYIKYPETADGLIETVAEGEKVYYYFNPQLIAIPDRFDEQTGTSNTANTTIPWQYDVKLNLKASSEQKLGNVRIDKTLVAPDDLQIKPCTVIFNVVGVYNDEKIYEKEHSINFNGNSSDSILIEGLPCDTVVTVTEEYPGAGYQVTTPASGIAVVTVKPDTTVSVSFENTLKTRTFGVGIINHFDNQEGWQVTNPDKD